MDQFDRGELEFRQVRERRSKLGLDIMVDPNTSPPEISEKRLDQIKEVADSMKKSKEDGKPILFAFGAHLVKNGLSKAIISLMEEGYINHILGNGAVSIHDWEFAYMGRSTEDVRAYVKEGQFGLWEETGKYINKAINRGARENQGYGASVGRMIFEGEIDGEKVEHQFPSYSILGEACRMDIPVSICSSIGQDIIHCHPECDGAALGAACYSDFMSFTNTLKDFEGGTYLSIGSAITSPQVFEKAFSMTKNIAINKGEKLENYNIFVNDIQPSNWDWSQGEPPMDHHDYYIRFFKSFSRMGGTSKYIELDNKDFVHNLCALLR